MFQKLIATYIVIAILTSIYHFFNYSDPNFSTAFNIGAALGNGIGWPSYWFG